MSLHPHQVIIPTRVSSERDIAEFEIAVAGTLEEIYINTDVGPISDASFTIKLNGSVVHTTVLLGGTTSITDTVSIAVVKGDRILIAVSILASFNFIGPKLFIQTIVEDGFPSAFGGTSATSTAIGTGSKAFTTQRGLAYTPGCRVRIASAANPTTKYMEGVVTAYSGTTLTVTIDTIASSGTYTDWEFSIAGNPGSAGASGPSGPTGPSGGPSGPTGPSGPSGAVSTVSGPTGSSGPSGPSGPSGSASTISGPTGPSGPSGPSGAASTVSGPTGSSGPSGPSGPSGGGGGGSINIYSVDKPYGTPSTEDDEFDAGSLDGKWSQQGAELITMTWDIPNHISIVPAHATHMNAIKQTASNVTRTWRMKIDVGKDGTNIPGLGFYLGSGGNARSDTFYYRNNTLYHDGWNGVTSVGTSTTNITTLFLSNWQRAATLYLELKYTPTGVTVFSWSFDGITWAIAETSTTYFGEAISSIGIYCNGSTSSPKSFVDWFRVLQGIYTGGNVVVS